MKFAARLGCLTLVSALAGLVIMAGCGTGGEIDAEQQTSFGHSAGTMSGFSQATGGEHYRAVETLGRPVAETVQKSANGIYQMK